MSSFFICLRLSGAPIEESEVKSMIAAGSDFARDDSQVVIQPGYAMAYHAFWTTQEDVGSINPFQSQESGCWYLYHGRIDNRSELIGRFAGLSKDQSDVEMLSAVHVQAGEQGLMAIKGPKALVVFDPSSKQVSAYRDFTGMRFLACWSNHQRLIISNQLDSLIAYPEYSFRPDPYMVASRFAFQIPQVNRTIAQGIRQLTPGFKASTEQLIDGRESLFYLPDPKRRLDFDDDEECAAEFRRLLDQSVERRSRSRDEVGSMLSGGLDSMPITIAVSNYLPESTIHCYSWVFDERSESDERRFIKPLISSRANLKANFINCDQRWFDVDQNPDMSRTVPMHTPWLANQYAALERAQQDGVSVLLSGLSGDILYEEDWVAIYDLIATRKISLLPKEARFLIANSGGFGRFLKRYMFAPTALMRHLRPALAKLGMINRTQPEWLTEFALDQLANGERSHLHGRSKLARRPTQYELVLGFNEPNDHTGMRVVEASYGIEKRQPFRDADLIEFMLAIPTRFLRFRHEFRPIVKSAYAPELPSIVARRNDKADFYPTIEPRVAGSGVIDRYLSMPESRSAKFVKDRYFAKQSVNSRKLAMIRWLGAYYEHWCEFYRL